MVFSSSMTNGIRVREFNKYYNHGTARFRRFPGTTAKRLLHYVPHTLIEETLEVVVIHVGGNDLPTKRSNPSSIETISKTIIEIGTLCSNYNVKEIFISGVIRRKGFYMEKRRFAERPCAIYRDLHLLTMIFRVLL